MKAIATLALISLLSATVQAQSTDLQRVEISGQPKLRHDVSRACPSIASQLERHLELPMLMQGQEGLVNVEFRLDGERTVDIVSKGGPRVYAASIRRAVRSVSCLPAETRTGDHFAFQIEFRPNADDSKPDAPQRLAMNLLQR